MEAALLSCVYTCKDDSFFGVNANFIDILDLENFEVGS